MDESAMKEAVRLVTREDVKQAIQQLPEYVKAQNLVVGHHMIVLAIVGQMGVLAGYTERVRFIARQGRGYGLEDHHGPEVASALTCYSDQDWPVLIIDREGPCRWALMRWIRIQPDLREPDERINCWQRSTPTC